MGLLRNMLGLQRFKDPVDGVAQIVSLSHSPETATHGNCNFTLVVQAEGIPATTVRHKQMIPTSKWPSPGESVPVTVDRADPTNLNIRFEELATTVEEAQAEAEQIAAALNAGTQPPVQAGAGDVQDIVSQLQQAFPGATIQVEGGQPMPPQAMPQQPAPGGAPAAPSADDPVQKLEKLAELHRQGLLDDEEFERAKARVLGLG